MPSSGLDVREYMAVYGCVRTLTTAVVAVRDISGPSASKAAGLGESIIIRLDRAYGAQAPCPSGLLALLSLSDVFVPLT